MKIAILYSGAIRNLIESISNNLEIFTTPSDQVDLYFSTWEDIGYVDNINSPDFLFSKRVIKKDAKVTENLIISLVPKSINIKNIKIEKYKNDYQFELIGGVTENLSAQFYKISDCCDLLDKDTEYDMIVRLRCDILFNRKIDKNLLHQLTNDNKIIFSSKIWYNHEYQQGYRSINDMMWVANQNLIRKTCNAYKNTSAINEIIKIKNQIELNFGESVCFMNLEAEKLVDSIYTYDFDYRILR